LQAESLGEPIKRKLREVEIALGPLQLLEECVQCRAIWWFWRMVTKSIHRPRVKQSVPARRAYRL
jgi:hypothetical protein